MSEVEEDLYFTAHYNWEWMIKLAFQQIATFGNKYTDEELSTSNNTTDSESTASGALTNRSTHQLYHIHDCKNFKQLPTSLCNKSIKGGYSLFRIDVMKHQHYDDIGTSSLDEQIKKGFITEESIVARVRVDSPSLSFMDPKDVLFRELIEYHAIDCMPVTHLIPWNVEDHLKTFSFPPLPTVPALLKAPLGSGGFGLYFVYHQNDIMEVIKQHRKRAEKEQNTLANIQSQECYHKFPLSWSLQSMVQPIRCNLPLLPEDVTNPDFHQKNMNRKSQIRVYLVECNNQLYMYDKVEVRFPLWDLDLDQTLAAEAEKYGQGDLENNPRIDVWTDEVEQECCGKGHARPYNEGRNKKYTDRYVVDEIPELVPALPAIKNCVKKAFSALKSRILNIADACEFGRVTRETQEGLESKASLAILGIDLLASKRQDDTYEAFIVEVNNNPAMPGENKRMSENYKQHLVEFGMSLVCLGLENSHRLQKTKEIQTLLERFVHL